MPHPATSLGTNSITNNSSINKTTQPSATLKRNLFHRSSIKNKRKQQFTVPNLSSPLFPLLSPTCTSSNRLRLSPLLHTVSDTELQQGPTSDYHGDTSIASYDIYNNFSDTSTSRNINHNLETAITDSLNKKDISLLFENNKPDLFETKHCLSSPNNSISPTILNRSLLNRENDTVLYSSAETTTTLLHIENTEQEEQDIKELRSSFKTSDQRENNDKYLLFNCDREDLGADDSLLPLLPPTPDITPVGSPILSPPPSPSRNTTEFSVSVSQLLGYSSGGAEGKNPPFCESSEYYGDEDADHHLDTTLIVDALQEAEAAGNQPSTLLPELQSRGPMRHSAGSALSSSSYQAGSSTNRDRIFNPSSYSTSSSYLRDRDLFGGGGSIYSYTGGRVPPTPPAHARPFSRSSSVPEQHYLQDFDPYDSLSKSSALNDYHTPFLGSTEKDPLSWQAALSSSSSKYGTSTSSLIGGHYRRQQRLNRLGKQLSLSSDLPISDFSSSSYLNDGFGVSRERKSTGLDSIGGSSSLSRGQLLRGHPLTGHSIHDAGTSLHSLSGSSSIGKSTRTGLSTGINNSRLLNRSSPLTLGKSLQLVTENFGSAAYNKEESNRRAVNKKTVRFNSEGSYNPLSAASSNVHNPSLPSSALNPLNPFSTSPGIYGNFSINGTSALDSTSNLLLGNHSNPLYGSSSYRYPHLSHKHSKSRLFDEFDICCDDDAWMTVEDVRSGRWARWDTQRQESQDSQTRDSGIETGSCFTSSEDSNRGGIVSAVGDHYLSKKVQSNY